MRSHLDANNLWYAQKMVSGETSKGKTATAIWWAGALMSVIMLLIHAHRHGPIDLSMRSPFDNTGTGHAEQWVFLSEAATYVPRGATFTVLASDRETEMSLFMMAVGLLPEALPRPSSYYGKPTDPGDRAAFVLELNEPGSVQPPETHATTVTGGRVTKRQAPNP